MNAPQEQASRELELIPKGDLAQNTFRMVFFAFRQNSLGRQPEIDDDVRVVVEKAAATVRATFPDFEPKLDPRLLN
jgi:hypothetical protein